MGRADAELISAQVEATRDVDGVVLEITAVLPLRDERSTYATWGTYSASVGDEVRIRLVEASGADPGTTVVHGHGEDIASGTTDWPLCSFCGRSYHDVHAMVSRLRGYICDSCIDEISKLRVEK